MRALTADELLGIWDTGRDASPSRRSLLLLSATLPEERENLANVPLGGVTARLLQMHASLFGPTLACLANCPACDTLIETAFSVEELLLGHGPQATMPEPAHHSFTYRDRSLEFRLPTVTDLIVVDEAEMRGAERLANRLISKSADGGASVPAEELPDGAIAAIEREIIKLDPLVQIELKLTCPNCRNSWEELLHVIDFLWLEIDNLARRLLFEVARLASRFGWSEREILALSPERRSSYLELIGA